MQLQNNFDQKTSPWFAFRIIVLLFAAVISGVLLYTTSTSTVVVATETASQSTPIQTIDTLYETEEWIPELPVRLVIPAIDVDAAVQYVGLDEAGTGDMGVPDNFTDVGWYEDGVRPGMRGSAVIAGHYNGKQTPQAVFYDLHTLAVGDEVVIMNADRIQDIFRVVKIATYDYDAPATEIFVSSDGKKRLNLITCSGDWLPGVELYNQRTVVFTELVTDVE